MARPFKVLHHPPMRAPKVAPDLARDQKAFDPAYDTLPLEHVEPMVRRVFASAQIVPTAG